MGTRSNSGLDGPTIRRLRNDRNWTQLDLVQQIRTAATDLGEFAPGVTVQMISRWENGKSGLSRENSRLVEHAFARTMDFNTESWEAEVDRRKFLAGSVSAGVALFGAAGLEPWQRLSSVLQHRNRLDLTAVENLETVTATFSGLFQTVAPMALIAPVQSHLGTLTQLPATVRSAGHSAAGWPRSPGSPRSCSAGSPKTKATRPWLSSSTSQLWTPLAKQVILLSGPMPSPAPRRSTSSDPAQHRASTYSPTPK